MGQLNKGQTFIRPAEPLTHAWGTLQQGGRAEPTAANGVEGVIERLQVPC